MEGEITFPNKTNFWNIYKYLRQGFWLDPEGYFLDEGGSRFTEESNVDFDQLSITIPHASHRNLARVEFFKNGAIGHVIGTSCDGCFIGWITTEKQDRHFDLDVWAVEELGEYAPDMETDFDSYCEWQCEVENDFFDFAQDQLAKVVA
jgi:hypothetical protein